MPGTREKSRQCPLCLQYYANLSSHQDKGVCKQQQALLLRNGGAPPPTQLIAQGSTVDDFLDKLQRLQQNVSLAPRVPRDNRRQVAISFVSVVDSCVQLNDAGSWRKLLLFAFEVFALPPRSKAVRSEPIHKIIRQNLQRFNSGTEHQSFPSQRKMRPRTFEEKLAVRTAAKLRDGDISGAVRALCSDDAVIPPTAESYRVMQEKHPSKDMKIIELPDNLPVSPAVSPEEILKAIKSFRPGSAGGPGGLTPQHLKDLVKDETNQTSQNLCNSLAELVNFMYGGKIPEAIRPILYGANLTALSKNDGGLRPIAAGNTLRRLAAKIMCSRLLPVVGPKLRPTQFGFATRGGCETVVHATRLFLQQERKTTEAIMKLDFRNAFNCLSRDKLMECAIRELPEYAGFIYQCYGGKTSLFFGEYVISSEEGVQQGDPAGPMLFSLATLPLTRLLKSRLKLFYLDDATLAGSIPDVCTDFQTIMEQAKLYGLELNLAKCEIFLLGGTDAEYQEARASILTVSSEVKFLRPHEVSLLGSPLNSESTATALLEKEEAAEKLVSRLSLIKSHEALFLLKNCLAIPKLQYLLRTSISWAFPDSLKRFDLAIQRGLASICNMKFENAVLCQSRLPVKYGGLGIRSAESLAHSAFLASVNSVRSLLSEVGYVNVGHYLREAEDQWKQISMVEPPEESFRHLQREWDLQIVKRCKKLLDEQTVDVFGKARLLAASARESGAWLEAVPVQSLGTLLTNEELRISVALRLGADLCVEHLCCCGKRADVKGYHGLNCKNTKSKIQRHDQLKEVIHRGMISAGYSSRIEPRGLSDKDNRRPDGNTLTPVFRGLPWAWDVTCADTLATVYIAHTSVKAGTAAEKAEERKNLKYKDIFRNFYFTPLAFESLGAWGPEALKMSVFLGKRISEQTGEMRSYQFFRQRLSLALQRGNARCVLSSLPTVRGLDEVFYVLRT